MIPPSAPRDPDLSDHVLRWLEAVQRRTVRELESVLDEAVWAVGPRRIRILQLIPPTGLQQKQLAERALISKQAMGEELAALEADGLAERTTDPVDGRARVVMRSTYGHQICTAMDRAMEAVEEQLARSVGVEEYATFKDTLRRLGADQI